MTTTGLHRPSAVGERVVSPSAVVVRLTVLLAVVVAVVAAAGLFAAGGPGPHEVTTTRGQNVAVYGTGLYRADSWLIGVGNRGTDAVTLFLEVPVLLAALAAYRRRSLRGTVVLVGVLGWLLYYYASMSLYTAYNRLFGLYVVAFGLALFAAPLALRSIDPVRFAAVFPSRPSRRLLVGYLGGLAAALTVAWLPALLTAAVTGDVPTHLDVYSTEVTWALDLGVVVPAVAATGWLLHSRAVWGPLAVTAMLALNVALGMALAAQGIAQLAVGVPVKAGEIVGAMASFAVMTAVAAALLLPLMRRLPKALGSRTPDTAPTTDTASTWCWSLTDLGDGRTRLVTRIRTRYEWHRPVDAAFGVLLMEVGDFAMLRRMLLGIRGRAAASANFSTTGPTTGVR